MIFENYAKYYDLIYSDKDYELESKYICNLLSEYNKDLKISNILDVGCGSGKHLHYISKNLECSAIGIDPSEEMIKIAKLNYENESLKFNLAS